MASGQSRWCCCCTQLGRLMQRDGSSAEAAQARVSAQMPVARKAEMADIIIDNNGDERQLEGRVRVRGTRGVQRTSSHWCGRWLNALGCGGCRCLLHACALHSLPAASRCQGT
jgi:dephospho-CoA kinase